MNQVATAPQKRSFSVMLQSDGYKKAIANTLTDPKRQARFVANISSAVANNPALGECDPSTILAGALLGESLNLSPSSMLGQFYLIPFNDRKNGRTVATFVLGYKGMIQLALRSGCYKNLDAVEIKKGEVSRVDKIRSVYEFKQIDDDTNRESAPTAGYYAFLEYINGFKKEIFWSKEKMQAHAKQYSKAYVSDLKNGWNNSFWTKDFDGMAKKTMLRQLISHWGLMSTEIVGAVENDGTAMIIDDTKQITASDISDVNKEIYYTVDATVTDETEEKILAGIDENDAVVSINDL